MVTNEETIQYLSETVDHQASIFNTYADATSLILTLLAEIRNCEICTMRGNGYCDEHIIAEKLTEAAVIINTVKTMLGNQLENYKKRNE